ncbi:EndoU domain-containing protein [Chryseobacterium sp. MP_3.2]|uniref:EndoU domain-containing protein n=1 Tax=Chryseobacterium sp. MP_3.2 TaxID=3071712 RepID=UPI002E04D7E9|nr:hypothetical protein [Chryseobacterium sp. MP_3.2]
MKEAVVLMNGYITYLDTITGSPTYNADVPIVFNRDGRVLMFTKENITYIALHNSKTNEFLYYAKAKDFWQNAIPTKDTFFADTYYSPLGSNVFKADNVPVHLDPANIYGNGVSTGKGIENGTPVILVTEKIIYESNNGYYTIEKRSFTFDEKVKCNESGTIVKGNLCSNQNFDSGIQHLKDYKSENFLKISIDSEEQIKNYRSRVADKKYRNEKTGEFYFDFTQDAPIIEDISYMFFKILKNSKLVNYLKSSDINLFQLFEIHFNIINYQDSESTLPGNAQTFYHKSYNERYFNLLYVRLIEFYYWAKGVENNFYSIEKMDVRIRVLSLFTENEIAELSYDYKIKLLEDILKTELIISGKWSIYNGTNLTEEELIIKIIRSFYREDTIGNPVYNEINNFLDYLVSQPRYYADSSKTLFEVLYRKIDDTLFFGDDEMGARGKYVQAVYDLWSESKYNPNHELPLVAANALKLFTYTPYQAIATPQGGDLAATRIINYESTKTALGYIDNYDFDFYNLYGLHKIKSIEKVPASPGSEAIRGYYHIYQPVTIKQTNADDTIVSVPKENGATPIFYLMYADSKGDNSDIKTGLGLGLDIALSFLGISEYKAISYLTKAGEFRKYLAGGLTAAEEVAFIANVAKGFAAAQSVLFASHFIFNFATNNCAIFRDEEAPPENDPDYNLCQEIDHWLFAVEMLTFSADLLAQRAFKRATRRLRQAIPNGTEYNGIRNAINGIDDVIEEFNQFKQFLLQNNYNKVYTKVEAFANEEDKFAFMFDFKGKNSYLTELENEINIIDDWLEVSYLKLYRKNIKFLKSYNFIIKDARCARLRQHILEGHHNNTGTSVSGWHHIFGNTNQNEFGRVIENTINNYDPRGYYSAQVEIKNQFGVYIPKTANGGINDMFPLKWQDKEVLENITLAFTTNVFRSGNQFWGNMSDGKILVICINGNSKNIDATTIIATVWPRR